MRALIDLESADFVVVATAVAEPPPRPIIDGVDSGVGYAHVMAALDCVAVADGDGVGALLDGGCGGRGGEDGVDAAARLGGADCWPCVDDDGRDGGVKIYCVS